MADSAGDLADVRLKIHSNNLRIDLTKSGDAEECYVYLGEVLKYEVIVKKPKDYEYKGWRKRVSQLSAHACLSPLDPKLKQKKLETKTSLKNAPKIIPKICDETKEHTTFSPVIATYIDTVENPLIDVASQSEKPYFKDSSTYIMPMSICVRDTPGQCHLAELNVILWLCISPLKTNPEVEAKKDFQLTTTADATNRKFVQQVSVSRTLHVHDPPQLNVRFVATGQQHLLLAEVKNRTRNTVTLKNLTIIPSPTPYFDHSKLVRDSSITEGPKSEWWNHVVCPAVSSGVMFPVTLRGCEELALVYRLDLSSVLSETELSFRTHLKWTHSETNREINTVYRLPKIRVRYPAFTVTVKCDGPVEARKTFYLTYNIANNLQDFLSVRLYWNLDSQLSLLQDRDDEEALAEKQTLEEVKRAVICHDPDIFIGSCPRGCTMPVNVGFQILQPGLYEMTSLCGAFWSYPDWLPQFQLFGELMKLNLRWALPDSQSTLKQDSVGTPVSSDTVSTLSADDQLAASAELWRDRSGSTSSLHTPTCHSAEEKRKSFATKSYSFGDLGPTLSADSDDVCRMRFKSIKRSSAVMPPRPPPPCSLSQAERDLTNRSNFLKKSFKIYIPSIS